MSNEMSKLLKWINEELAPYGDFTDKRKETLEEVKIMIEMINEDN